MNEIAMTLAFAETTGLVVGTESSEAMLDMLIDV